MGRRKNFSREDVLDRSIPVFWTQGLADTTVQDLERATGVNKSGLYAEFKDKNDLFAASLRRYLELLAARGILTQQPLGWDNIESFLKLCLGTGDRKGCFSVNSMREFPQLPAAARHLVVQSAASIRTLLLDNIAAEKGSDAPDLADLILTFFTGICLEQNLDPGEPIILGKIETFMRLIRSL